MRVPLQEGKAELTLLTPNESYMAGMCGMTDLRNKTLSLADVTFKYIPDDKVDRTATDIRISPRGTAVPAGVPVQFSATVVNGKGLTMPATVSWKCQGGRIDAQGRFLADGAGPCRVTAEAAGAAETVLLQAADRFVDTFNEGNAYLKPGWTTLDLGGRPGRWYPHNAGGHFTGSLWQHSPATQSALLWQPGVLWGDYTVGADVILWSAGRFQLTGTRVHGLVARARGRQDHYRLVIERRPDGSAARLVKRKDGRETILAQTTTPPELAPFDWRTNPCCPGLAKAPAAEQHARENGWDTWRLDRMELAVSGHTLRARINGKDAFPQPIQDGDLSGGAPGLYAENVTVFDNFEVQPSK